MNREDEAPGGRRDHAGASPAAAGTLPSADTLPAPPIQIRYDTSGEGLAPTLAAGAGEAPTEARRFDSSAATLAGDVASSPVSLPDLDVADQDRYVVSGELARGGLGRILRATDRRLRRPVALKELLQGGGDAEARFLREALVTARLQHPSIIPLYDAARWPTGHIFYSMKLVSGSSLEEAIESKKTLAERLSLLPHVIDVAEAIAYAHSRRIIHRDLKPQNVLVGAFGETVVIDWGIAKDLDAGLTDSDRDAATRGLMLEPGLTLEGAVMGTPAYMPPEQAHGKSVDERADVYALGALLYHLLAGAPPYDDAPVRAVLQELLATPPVGPPPLHRKLHGVPPDLLAIVDKAMAPAPEDRYPSARELAHDLKKFQTGQIVGAYAYSPSELVLRWVRKNRVVTALLALLVVAAGVTVGQIVDKGRVAERGRRAAESEREKAEAAREKAARAEERERRRADEVTLQQARLSLDVDPERSLAFLDQLSPSFPHHGAMRIIAADALSRALPRTLRGHTGGVSGMALSPDGKVIASVSYDRTARLWDPRTRESKVLAGHTGEVMRLGFSPDGKRLMTASYDKTARLWDVATGASVVLSGHTDWLSTAVFSGDGRALVTASGGRDLKIWDIESSPPTSRALPVGDQSISSVAISPDRGTVVGASFSGELLAWDTRTGARRSLGPSGDGYAIAGDARSVAISHRDGSIDVLEVASGWARRVAGFGERLTEMMFSRDGRLLTASGEDRRTRILDLATGKVLHTSRDPAPALVHLTALSRDGSLVAMASLDGSIRVWSLATGAVRLLRAHTQKVTEVVFSPDATELFSAGMDGTVRVWPLSEDTLALEGRAAPHRPHHVLSDDRRVVAIDAGEALRVWDLETRRSEPLEGHTAPVQRLAISGDRRILASAAADRVVRLWDAGSAPVRALATIGPLEARPRDLALSEDGKSLAVLVEGAVQVYDAAPATPRLRRAAPIGHPAARVAITRDGAKIGLSGGSAVSLLDVESGARRALAGHDSMVLAITFSPDGKLLATAGLDRTSRVWDVATGEARVFAGGDGGVYDVRFSPAGDLLAAGTDVGVVRVWSLKTGEGRALRGHDGHVTTISFSPDGSTLASGGEDHAVRLWDVATGEVRALSGHGGDVSRVVFSPGGGRLVTMDAEGAVRVHRDDLPRGPEPLRARIRALAGGATR